MIRCARCPKFIESGTKIGRFTYCEDCTNGIIDPLVYQAALELSAQAGEAVKNDMRKAGMTEPQIKEVFDKAFAWLHEGEKKSENSA